MRKIKRTIKYVISIGLLLSACTFAASKGKEMYTQVKEQDIIPDKETIIADTEDMAKAASDTARQIHETIVATAASEDSEEISDTPIPEYNGKAYVSVNNNRPHFTDEEVSFARDNVYESYGELDLLGRCQACIATVGPETMPTEPRGEIGMVKPSGWIQEKYPGVVNADNPDEPAYLYNRCHLIGFQLTGENANERNLVTGTRYFNVNGMLDCENMVADYVRSTGNHVLYRVTPIFEDFNLVCSGVLMEAYSLEDDGQGVQFCVYAYNVQPGITIDYLTGKSHLSEDS